MRRLTLIVVMLAGLVLLSACGSGPGGTTNPSSANSSAMATSGTLSGQTTKSGPVDVSVTPTRVDPDGASFEVVLDNHELDLTANPAAAASLSVDGVTWTNSRWLPAKETGHHQSGTLTFDPPLGAPVSGKVELRLNPASGGIPEAVQMSWTM